MTDAESVQSQVDEALRRSDGIAEVEDTIAPVESDITEASPWLQLTRWPEYVRGNAFSDVARLAKFDMTCCIIMGNFNYERGHKTRLKRASRYPTRPKWPDVLLGRRYKILHIMTKYYVASASWGRTPFHYSSKVCRTL
jgi:hypothetical protein